MKYDVQVCYGTVLPVNFEDPVTVKNFMNITGYKLFKETRGLCNYVLYNPVDYEVVEGYDGTYLHYIGLKDNVTLPINLSSMYKMFDGCTFFHLTISDDINKYITDLDYAFSQSEVSIIDISFDTNNVVSMLSTFEASNAQIISFNNCMFDNVKTTKNMCNRCFNLVEIHGISSLIGETTVDISFMFNSCYRLRQLDLSLANTDNVADARSQFISCIQLCDLSLPDDYMLSGSVDAMFVKCIHLHKEKLPKHLNVEMTFGKWESGNNVDYIHNNLYAPASSFRELLMQAHTKGAGVYLPMYDLYEVVYYPLSEYVRKALLYYVGANSKPTQPKGMTRIIELFRLYKGLRLDLSDWDFLPITHIERMFTETDTVSEVCFDNANFTNLISMCDNFTHLRPTTIFTFRNIVPPEKEIKNIGFPHLSQHYTYSVYDENASLVDLVNWFKRYWPKTKCLMIKWKDVVNQVFSTSEESNFSKLLTLKRKLETEYNDKYNAQYYALEYLSNNLNT